MRVRRLGCGSAGTQESPAPFSQLAKAGCAAAAFSLRATVFIAVPNPGNDCRPRTYKHDVCQINQRRAKGMSGREVTENRRSILAAARQKTIVEINVKKTR
jgi:hypothetical protein